MESVLRQLFQEQYSLSFSEETEIRYRTETSVDPETGEETEEEVPYEWRILNVKLTVTPLENLVVSRMNADQKEICEILLQTKGNRQYVKNVFGTNWLPYVTSYYGYRVHPISGEKNYHTGVDIGMPQGTEIFAGHDGTVTLAGNAGGYGLCVAIEGEAYEGHTLTTKYGHCSQLLVSAGQEVKAGDVIAKVGQHRKFYRAAPAPGGTGGRAVFESPVFCRYRRYQRTAPAGSWCRRRRELLRL